MLKRNYKLDRLATVEGLTGVRKSTLRQVAGLTTLLQLPAGKVLWEQGEMAREAFLLLDGEVELTWSGTPLETLRSGAVIGGVGLEARAPRVATTTTRTEVEALVLSRAEYVQLLHLCPEVGQRVEARHRARSFALRPATAGV